jgi:signal transduction histidine kinase
MTDHDKQAINTAGLILINRRRTGNIDYKQIISSISHELRTPVAILKSNIQFIKEFDFDMNQELKDESISMCEDSVESIVGFLDNIQLINMVAKSQIIPSLSFFKLNHLVHKVNVELEKKSLNYKRISVHWEMPVHDVYSDPVLVSQILCNLCANAIKFSGKEVDLYLITNKHELIIKIQDYGIGIPEEEHELIFNPFFRGTNAKRVPGYGLGLAIVGSITDYLGGKIYLSSEVNLGTIIKIILPCETSPSAVESRIL